MIAELIAAVHAAGGTIERHGREIRLTATQPLPDILLARLRRAKPALVAHLHEPAAEPVLLADGRRLHRFRADLIPDRIPASLPHRARELSDRASAHGVVLVADGPELIVVERYRSELPPELLQQLRDTAGEVIACLRGEADARFARLDEPPL